jgi:hypothetical protein
MVSRSIGTTYAGDIMAVNLKTLNLSALSGFLVATSIGFTVPTKALDQLRRNFVCLRHHRK